MEKKINELDVDYIGGKGALTHEEEKALSEYFTKKKLIKNKFQSKRAPRINKRQKSKV
jgi:hypothetical protein